MSSLYLGESLVENFSYSLGRHPWVLQESAETNFASSVGSQLTQTKALLGLDPLTECRGAFFRRASGRLNSRVGRKDRDIGPLQKKSASSQNPRSLSTDNHKKLCAYHRSTSTRSCSASGFSIFASSIQSAMAAARSITSWRCSTVSSKAVPLRSESS